jgi:hypothetical protein
MNEINFSCTALNGTGKQGKLPKDSDGYYTMPVGGLNVWNSAGDFYPYEAAKELFTESSSLMRRVSTGCLKGEMGHPKPLPSQSMDSFADRVMAIEETRVCSHFSQIWLDFNSIKDETGKPVVAIMAKVAPSGPYGPALATSLENNKEDVCFSIRAFTEDVNVAGVRHRMLRQIVSFDSVVECGISIARKYKSPTLESYNAVSFKKEDIVKQKSSVVNHISMESTKQLNADLISILGWNIPEKPNFTRW